MQWRRSERPIWRLPWCRRHSSSLSTGSTLLKLQVAAVLPSIHGTSSPALRSPGGSLSLVTIPTTTMRDAPLPVPPERRARAPRSEGPRSRATRATVASPGVVVNVSTCHPVHFLMLGRAFSLPKLSCWSLNSSLI